MLWWPRVAVGAIRQNKSRNSREEPKMDTRHWRFALPMLAGLLAVPLAVPPADAQTPKKGGILKFVVPGEFPTMDGHRENTFALIHPLAPFYSVLIRVNPEDPA